MRELLRKWAELEPEHCKLVENDYFQINLDANNWHSVYADNLTFQDLMWIQWAVQAAIVSQGWRYNLECYPITGICEGVVFLSPVYTRRRGSSPAEALLSAYLVVLEAER